MEKDNTRRRRTKQRVQKEPTPPGRPTVVQARKMTADDVLRRADVQEHIALLQAELDILDGGFQTNGPAERAWRQRLYAEQDEAERRDSELETSCRAVLADAGLPWPEHWRIDRDPPTSQR